MVEIILNMKMVGVVWKCFNGFFYNMVNINVWLMIIVVESKDNKKVSEVYFVLIFDIILFVLDFSKWVIYV